MKERQKSFDMVRGSSGKYSSSSSHFFSPSPFSVLPSSFSSSFSPTCEQLVFIIFTVLLLNVCWRSWISSWEKFKKTFKILRQQICLKTRCSWLLPLNIVLFIKIHISLIIADAYSTRWEIKNTHLYYSSQDTDVHPSIYHGTITIDTVLIIQTHRK